MEDDFLAAPEQYSQYAFDSILKEDDPSKGKLEQVLYEFADVAPVLNRGEMAIPVRFGRRRRCGCRILPESSLRH